jgi:hypothetical protein
MADRSSVAWIDEVLAFRAPYLEEKLVKDQIAGDRDEARRLFQEVKKYFILVHLDPARGYPVYSHRVDAVWHEFVLFTEEYARFCSQYFGTYLQHDPANAPRAKPAFPGAVPAGVERGAVSYAEFCDIYETQFECPLPDLWRDDVGVTLNTRLRNEHVTASSVRVRAGQAELLRDGDIVLARVDVWGEGALRFIATHGSFFARELPDALKDEDRLALCRALVRSRALRVAP